MLEPSSNNSSHLKTPESSSFYKEALLLEIDALKECRPTNADPERCRGVEIPGTFTDEFISENHQNLDTTDDVTAQLSLFLGKLSLQASTAEVLANQTAENTTEPTAKSLADEVTGHPSRAWPRSYDPNTI